MKYTKAQIKKLGIRPRGRTSGPLLRCEEQEVRRVSEEMLDDDTLWQTWRLIPFSEGYACHRRAAFEKWIRDEVHDLWVSIGIPTFEDGDDMWHCDAGWWPYLDKKYQDISWVRVGKALIDLDEVHEYLYNILREKVRGYRMCPGMMLYRVMREIVKIDYSEMKRDDTRRKMLWKQVEDLVQDDPTETTKHAEDKEYYN